MKVLLSAKRVLLISLFCMASTATAKMEIIPQLKCGEYLLRGKLVSNNIGDFILRIRENTTSPFEVIVLSGDTEEKLENTQSVVVVKVLIEKEITSNQRPFVKLLSFVDSKTLEKDETHKLLKSGKCR